MSTGIRMAEKAWLPDSLIRFGIRRLQAQRIQQETCRDTAQQNDAKRAFVERLKQSPLVLFADQANEQHYELPPEFFQLVMGDHLKYSCCYFSRPDEALTEAEARMLALTCERADIRDGQKILELGCGWGSLTHWIGARYPNAQILAVSNSALQRRFIEQQCRERGIDNVSIVTQNFETFEAPSSYDRIVSVEMFEHLRNWEAALERVSEWLRPDGAFFAHVFCHRDLPYTYEPGGPEDWMGNYFFSGGLMPSDDLFHHFQKDLVLRDHWTVDGRHYQRTANAWLANMDRNRGAILRILARHYGERGARLWFQRWRIFFMACSELWGYNGGQEWWVGHYKFMPKPPAERISPQQISSTA